MMGKPQPDFMPAIFLPTDPYFSKKEYDVLVNGCPRADYRVELIADGPDRGWPQVIFPRLTYDEACTVQIVKKAPVPRSQP